MRKSKFFRVALEGATTDGRKISKAHIEQMAKNYDPQKYGARIWIEHIRGYHPDSMFSAMGDVIALKTEEIEGGKLALLAQIDPTDELIQFNKRRKAVYSSIELDPNFADTGEAYLVGLAVTDSPASLGTEMLQFSAQASVNPLTHKKQKAENTFSEALEFALELQEGEPDDSFGKRLFTKVMGILKPETEKSAATLESFQKDVTTAVEMLAVSQRELMDKYAAIVVDKLAVDELKADLAAQSEAFNALKAQLEAEPIKPSSSRPAATGNGNLESTDC